jgi:quinol monooxygenase YgiN
MEQQLDLALVPFGAPLDGGINPGGHCQQHPLRHCAQRSLIVIAARSNKEKGKFCCACIGNIAPVNLTRKGDAMAIRLVLTITAAPGKGSELAQAYRPRCAEIMKEPGCEQFEVFQSAVNPDKLALLERWTDQAALDAHAQLNSTRTPLPPELRSEGRPEREDYQYNRTR